MVAESLRVLEHSKIAFGHLRDAPVGPRLEHFFRHKSCLNRLHRLVPQDPWLPVVTDMCNVFKLDPSVIKTEPYCFIRKTAMVLFARESFLFRSRDKLTV